MKPTRVLPGLAVAFLALFVGSCCSAIPASNLRVALHPQETRMWCWAASGQMVMDYLGNDVAQCVQANDRFGRNDCPCDQCGANPAPNPPCVIGGWPDFGNYGFTFKRTSNSALSWDDLVQELSTGPRCGRTPIAFTWRWNGGGGHMMVARGYLTVAGTRYVVVQDPWAPCTGDSRIITYAAYVSGTTYTHWDDFYEIRD